MDQVQQVREKTDIVQLLSEYLPLKQMGRNFKCPCPFHQEKTPSFVVSPERQIWHCFGCQKGGDVFTFLMEYEHMEFAEAFRSLAKRTGIELIQHRANNQVRSQKEQAYELNHLTAEFYHYVLTKHAAGKHALQYLTEIRGINPKIIETFKIGFSPRIGNALTKYLTQKKKYTFDELLAAGLSVKRGMATSDFFFNRLMFPLIDHRDNIVGFSARALDNSLPKYINTRETLVYSKSNQLFGINITKNEIKQKNQAIIVEGEFDVISLFQSGVGNVVGIKGTAFTENQALLLKRFTNKITLALDADKAGQQAIKRSLPILERNGFTTTVLLIPGGKDPDEAVKTDEYGFKQAVKNEENLYEYLLNLAVKNFNVQTSDGKQAIASELLPIFASIDNEIVKEHYLKKLGELINTSVDTLQKEIAKQSKTTLRVQAAIAQTKKRSREELLEEYLVSLLLQSEKLLEITSIAKSIITAQMFTLSSLGRIIELLFAFVEKGGASIAFFAKTLPTELLPEFDRCYLAPLPEFDSQETLVKEFTKKAYELKLSVLKKQIGSDSTDSQVLQQLQEDYQQTKKMLQSL